MATSYFEGCREKSSGGYAIIGSTWRDALRPPSDTMNVLVTGATGFTGWHVARHLRAQGHRVRALVRSTEKAEHLLAPLGVAHADLVQGDMTDRGAVSKALDGCDRVVHAAATVSVQAGADHAAFEANVTGTRNVIGGACERGGMHCVFVSSLTAIFDPKREAISADSPLVTSSSRYGESKARSDALVRELVSGGAPIATIYPSAILGPDDPGRSESMSAFRGFVRTMLDTAGGTQFVDARDLAMLIEALLGARYRGGVVAAGPYFAWPELIDLVEEVTGAKVGRIRAPAGLLRLVGGLSDIVSRLSGRSLPMSREAMEIATRWKAIPDSSALEPLGIRWRPPQQTLADVYRFFVETGGLPASAVPRIAVASGE